MSSSHLQAATCKSSSKAQFPTQDTVQPCRRVWRLPRVLDLTEHRLQLDNGEFFLAGKGSPSLRNHYKTR